MRHPVFVSRWVAASRVRGFTLFRTTMRRILSLKRLVPVLLLASICALAQTIGLEPTAQIVVSIAHIYKTQAKAVIDVRDYGAVGDGEVATDCYMTSGRPLLSCESHHFVASDVGKKIAVYGSGPPLGDIFSHWLQPSRQSQVRLR